MLSRIEGTKDLPTLPTLARLASAIGAKVEIRFVDRKNRELRRVPPIRVGHKLAPPCLTSGPEHDPHLAMWGHSARRPGCPHVAWDHRHGAPFQ